MPIRMMNKCNQILWGASYNDGKPKGGVEIKYVRLHSKGRMTGKVGSMKVERMQDTVWRVL